ncbi:MULTISPECIES: ATP-binding protein [unclassified Gordonia (in: high G+C Gram-positive bacteria)]|uniref:sensor histidine kinase n=1 Tax=unclassified Gordonia (in: high G+C Gram-positive bacteria) TaxID=2657482 RepID=UPI001F1182CC|nr:ATP-binding protein [Gordonia sp. ABSL49_1]MCH5643524.1 ATP-binding protein [Gordonia sp. ABSL49_1]
MADDERGLAAVADEGAIREILLDHGLRGIRIQVLLRVILAAFVVLVIAFDPPADYLVATWIVVGCYVIWSVITVLLARRGDAVTVRLMWSAVFVDLGALTVLAVLASRSDSISWTSDVLLTGFAIIPMMGATSLRPWVPTVIAVPTVVVYFATTAAARPANGEPWSLVILHTVVIGALALASVLLSLLQRSRVMTIGSLAADRAHLLSETLLIEDRERRDLADALHDGAMQYVLAARHTLSDVRRGDDPDATDRLDAALTESSRLLRSTLTTLNPAVLDHHGLAVALDELGRSVAVPGGLDVVVDVAGWSPEGSTSVDALLYATARELVANVVKHAGADRLELSAEWDAGQARLVVVDDGVGIGADLASDAGGSDRLAERLTEGHLGLMSRRVRLEAAGGTLTVDARPTGGTVAIAEVPVRQGG